jgi:hypothetical protein
MDDEIFYDLFSDGRWIGMSKGRDEDEAKRLAAKSLPALMGRFTLVRWHGRLHPENCKTSGGLLPDPPAEPPINLPQSFLRRIVDRAWNEATESTNVPSTHWADRIIESAR